MQVDQIFNIKTILCCIPYVNSNRMYILQTYKK